MIKNLSVFVKRSHAARAYIIVGLKSLDFAVSLMKISAESTLGVTVRVAYVVTANLAFTTNCTNFAHDDTSEGNFDLLK